MTSFTCLLDTLLHKCHGPFALGPSIKIFDHASF